MGIDPDALAAELRALRRGPGILRQTFPRQVGPETAQLCGITDADTARAARQKFAGTVERLLRDEAPWVRTAATAAFGLRPDANRFLTQRQRWLAGELGCGERVARRRVGEVTEILVRLATEAPQERTSQDGWRVQAIDALLLLDRDGPVLVERRTIVMLRNGIDEITTRFSLPRPHPCAETPHGLTADVLFGGRLRGSERLSDQHFRYRIELHRPLLRGEVHKYGIEFRLPAGQVMAPHYALVPLLPVESLELRIRFPVDRLPARVWQLNGVAPRMIDAPPAASAPLLRPNDLGEVELRFCRLRQGFGYGARWDPRAEAPP